MVWCPWLQSSKPIIRAPPSEFKAHNTRSTPSLSQCCRSFQTVPTLVRLADTTTVALRPQRPYGRTTGARGAKDGQLLSSSSSSVTLGYLRPQRPHGFWKTTWAPKWQAPSRPRFQLLTTFYVPLLRANAGWVVLAVVHVCTPVCPRPHEELSKQPFHSTPP